MRNWGAECLRAVPPSADSQFTFPLKAKLDRHVLAMRMWAGGEGEGLVGAVVGNV